MRNTPAPSLPGRWAGRIPRLSLLALLAAFCGASAGGNLKVDGEKALAHAQAIAAKGPRPPGSPALRQVGLYLIEQMKEYGLRVQTDSFSPLTPRGQIEMINIWGVLEGAEPGVLIIASHYDSKVFDDFAFVGANDGGSSSALVLELARTLSAGGWSGPSIWFVFFDGEEALQQWSDYDSLYGSREFVRMLRERGTLKEIRAMVLLDLIGAKEVRFPKEHYSTGWLKDLVWRKAGELGHQDVFLMRQGTPVEDDHLPFVQAGVPAVDIIDLEYAYWHTPEDTADKLSAESLAIVGNVVLASLPEIASRTASGR